MALLGDGKAWTSGLLVLCLGWSTACGSRESGLTSQPRDGHLAVAGLRWQLPASWERLDDAPRIWARYRRPAVAPDRRPAELVVHYRPGDPGGTVDQALRHWMAQMTSPQEDAPLVPLRSRWSALDATYDFLEVDGIYERSLGGGPMTGGRTKAEPGSRLFAVVVKGPAGRAFLKMVGPRATVRRMEEEFRAMIALHADGGVDSTLQ